MYVPAQLPHAPCSCASVVMWLESLAEDALSSQGVGPVEGGAALGTPGAVGPLLSDHEGVWLETRTRLGQGGCKDRDGAAGGRAGSAH